MKANSFCNSLSAAALVASALLAGCSAAPEIGVTAVQPGDLFSQATEAAFQGNFDYIKSCVESDARYLEAYDPDGRTLLHYAAEGGHIEIVRYLIEAGARVNVDDNDGYYPLDAAVQGDAPQEVVDLIREALAQELGRY